MVAMVYPSGTLALDHLDLSIEAGELVSLVGSSCSLFRLETRLMHFLLMRHDKMRDSVSIK